MSPSSRGVWLTTAAMLFGALAVSNLIKPLELYPDHGFVFFGHRLSGATNRWAGPLFGAYLAIYARSIWAMRWAALPLGLLYGTYVAVNLVMFGLWGPMHPGWGYRIFSAVFASGALVGSIGPAYLLARHRQLLR